MDTYTRVDDDAIYYRDVHGREVWVDYEYLPEHGYLVLVDASTEHEGMSITNSIEQALEVIRNWFDFDRPINTIFEMYPNDPSTLSRVERAIYGNDAVNWYPASERDLEIIFGY